MSNPGTRGGGKKPPLHGTCELKLHFLFVVLANVGHVLEDSNEVRDVSARTLDWVMVWLAQ